MMKSTAIKLLITSKFVNYISQSCLNKYATTCCGCTVTYTRRYSTGKQVSKKKIDLSEFPVENIRNFSIVAHVDHGKSTLADRLLEYTGTISKDSINEQVLDKLQVEKERGITVKAQTASLIYTYNNQKYLLNLIDTPGHVDFSYEVSRSLRACQGVILLVDANQGVQAQTLANFFLAFEQELAIIPVMNKIDLKVAKPEVVQQQMLNLFDFKPEEIIKISAKHGTGIEDVLKNIIEKIPPPDSKRENPTKLLIFDSWFDKFRGAICNIAVKDGKIAIGDKICSVHTQKKYEVQDLGILYPSEYPTDVLYAGQVGYLIAHMRTSKEAQIGDTLHLDGMPVEKLPGFKPAKPMVFAGIFPVDQSEYVSLSNALEKLTLNDSSVEINIDSSATLGPGWRLGFLGLLHLDVFSQRLEQEYNTSVIITSPNVPYKVKISGQKNINIYGGDEVKVLNPCLMPDDSMILQSYEPMVLGTIIASDDHMQDIVKLCMERRGAVEDQSYIDNKRLMFKVVFPLSEILVDFFDDLKSLTSGYASFDYEDYGYQETSLVKLDVFLNGKLVEDMTQIVHVSKARTAAKHIATKLKTTIPRQLFLIAVQVKYKSKVLAREDIKAITRDVTAKCYGGDISRKKKLLKRQADGKKRMRKIGNVDVPKDAFISIVKR